MNAAKKHLNLYFPQWQGGGTDSATCEGAAELKEYYLSGYDVAEVQVSMSPLGKEKNNIVGYDDILAQLKEAKGVIEKYLPSTAFTVGAGCDADILSVSYMNAKTKGDMTLLWIDAHGDIHTPESSETKRFYGMPIRVLLGEGDEAIVKLMFSRLEPSQLVMAGVRDLDKAEKVFIPSMNISVFTAADTERSPDAVLDAVRSKGHSNVYIHIDLDALEPGEFPCVRLPVPGGIKMDTLRKLLGKLSEEFKIVGMGMFEYVPSGGRRFELLEYIASLGTGL
jgi:arginase